jgi:hypothetical protein
MSKSFRDFSQFLQANDENTKEPLSIILASLHCFNLFMIKLIFVNYLTLGYSQQTQEIGTKQQA